MEIVRCDGCNQDIKRNTRYFELGEKSQGFYFPAKHDFSDPIKLHFCSFECVGKWVDKERRNKMEIEQTIDKLKMPIMIHPNT